MGEVSRWRWVAPALALGLLALGAVLVDLAGPTVLHQAEPGGPVANWLITLAVTLPCTAVGVLLAARRPANPIGWLLLTLLLLTAEPSDVYAILDYRLHHGTLPLGWVAVLFIGGPLANDTIELGSSVLLVCVAIAVLKYRLYAIDRIISRVISYLGRVVEHGAPRVRVGPHLDLVCGRYGNPMTRTGQSKAWS